MSNLIVVQMGPAVLPRQVIHVNITITPPATSVNKSAAEIYSYAVFQNYAKLHLLVGEPSTKDLSAVASANYS